MAIETVLLRIATTIATAGGKALVAGRRSAAERRMTLMELAGVRGLGLLPQRRLNRQLEQLAETIAERLQSVVEGELSAMPSAERELVLKAVAQTLEATEFTDEVLFAANLDDAILMDLTDRAARAVLAPLDLGEKGTEFFRQMLRESIAHLTEVIVTLPSFGQRALRELLSRDTEIIDLLRQVLAQMPQRLPSSRRTPETEFEVEYCRNLVRRLDRVELFGVTVAGPTRRYPLDVAYIGLSLSGHDDVEVGLDRVVSASRCVYIRGEAGSGKTTLLRWLALKCARSEHEGLLAPLSRGVPLMVELRRFAERELPGPSEFTSGLSRSLAERTPEGWADGLLFGGRAVLLIDGVDEFPAQRRPELLTWISDLVHEYPQARIVVTSRPAATPVDWLASAGFAQSDLMPMSRPHIAAFVRHWHAAIAAELGGQKPVEEVDGFRRAMVAAIDQSRPLRLMATNPLLCALLCALNWDRHTQLPHRRIEIYRAALEMLLRRRDHERRLSSQIDIGLEYDDRLSILQDLAYWFTRNGLTDAPVPRVRAKLESIIDNMPHVRVPAPDVYDFLLARSGVLREPVPGRIDFIHKTFQEYLAAIRFVEDDAIDGLVRDAGRDELQEVIVMAAGCARQREAERLITALLDLAERPRQARARRARLRLLAISCSEVTSRMSRAISDRILSHLGELVPPTTPGAARVLAGLGEDVLAVLPDGRQDLVEHAAAATMHTAALIGGQAALRLIGTFADDRRTAVCRERLKAWTYFDAAEFARVAFGSHDGGGWRIALRDPTLLPGVPHITDAGTIRCDFVGSVSEAQLNALRTVKRLDMVKLRQNREIVSLDFLGHARPLRSLTVEQCVNLRNLDAVTFCRQLQTLVVRECPVRLTRRILDPLAALRTLAVEDVKIDIESLADRLPRLSRLELTNVSDFDSTARLGRNFALSSLTLAWCEDLHEIVGLGDIPLRALTIIGCQYLASLVGVGDAKGLQSLRVKDLDHLYDDDFLFHLPNLENLTLENCGIATFGVLPRMSLLRELVLVNNSTVPDLGTLLGLPNLARLRVNGLRRHLGPDMEEFVARLTAGGIEVVTEAREDEEWLPDTGNAWSPDEEEPDLDDWVDPDELPTIG